MSVMADASGSTAALLLETLRGATGRDNLCYAMAPARLGGGFYAEMLRFRLADPPTGLDGDLVARIVPNAEAGAREATIQRAVAEQGFPTPAVRLTADDSSALGRYLVVMDLVDGRPPMDGLDLGTVATRIPHLVRHLPDQLADIAARLHRLDVEPLAERLAGLDGTVPLGTAGFVADQAGLAAAFDRPDLVAVAEGLIGTQPRSGAQVIVHGDLHPFNLLVTVDGTWLIDWTVARIAHPAFTVAFTTLMLDHPPIAVPGVAAVPLQALGRYMSRRFLRAYRAATRGTPAAVDDQQLDWHRRVHALRILVETAGWDAHGSRPTSGHPWLLLEPVAARTLGLVGSRRQQR